MNRTIMALAAWLIVSACAEPDHARGREPAEALQVDPTQRSFLEDAPSYRVAEAIRSAALEVRPERALFLTRPMEPDRAAEEELARPGERVASHPAFPFNALVRLTHRETDASVEVRMVEPGPFVEDRTEPLEPDPAIAISPEAAERLGVGADEQAHVWVEIVEW